MTAKAGSSWRSKGKSRRKRVLKRAVMVSEETGSQVRARKPASVPKERINVPGSPHWETAKRFHTASSEDLIRSLREQIGTRSCFSCFPSAFCRDQRPNLCCYKPVSRSGGGENMGGKRKNKSLCWLMLDEGPEKTSPSSLFQTANTLKMKALKVAAKKPLQ